MFPSMVPDPPTPPGQGSGAEDGCPALPTETEIYILPDGEVIVADLPAELAALVDRLAPSAGTGRGLP
jgi:hypothetical protein